MDVFGAMVDGQNELFSWVTPELTEIAFVIFLQCESQFRRGPTALNTTHM